MSRIASRRSVGVATDHPPLPLRAVGVLLSLAFAFPAIYLVWRNFDSDANPWGLLLDDRTLDPLWRTIRLAVSVSLSAAVIGTALAWLTVRTDLPARRMWRVVLPVPLVFPTFIGAAAFIRTLNPGGLLNDLLRNVGVDQTPEMRGFVGAWLVLTLFTYPYVYLPVAARLRHMPGSLEESARVLGDSAFESVRRIVMPQVAGSVMAGTLLVFLYTVSDFGAVQLMRYDTLTRAINTNFLAQPPVALALSLILLVLAGAVVAIERAAAARLAPPAPTRSRRAVEYRLGRWRWTALVVVAAVAALAIVAPVATLLDWAYDGSVQARESSRGLVIDTNTVVESSVNTLRLSIVTALVAVLAVLPIAFLVGRYRAREAGVHYAVVISTFALPGILIALSVIYFVNSSDTANSLLAGTMVLLVFALVVRFGSLAMGTALEAVRSVPPRLHDAAATLGASRSRRLRTVDLKIMTPGLLAGAGLVLLSTMKELPITLLVSPREFPTLTTRTFFLFEEAFIAEAGILALALVAMSAILSWVLVLRRADHL